MMDGGAQGIRTPWDEPPEPGAAIEVAEGVLWLRLPLPMTLDHVNVYALDEGDHWSIVDTGVHSRSSVALWEDLLAGVLKGKPVGRVILTHYHPDHIGMVGWLMARGAEHWTTRLSYTTGRMLLLDVEDRPTPQALEFWHSAGMDPDILEQRRTTRPFNFADLCHPLPVGFTRISQGDVIRAAGRDWDIHIGHGHAPHHLTMWSRDDNLVIAGDQILQSISPNISVHPAEPLADPLADWLESCARLAPLAREDHLVLGGHKLPFTGLPLRMAQLADNHHGGLRRLRAHLATPRPASGCFAPLFKRKITGATYGLALAETLAHLNHLLHLGQVRRWRDEAGVWQWQAVAEGDPA